MKSRPTLRLYLKEFTHYFGLDCLEELEAIIKMIESTKSLDDADLSEANTIYRCLDNLARNEFSTAKKISEKMDGFHSEMIMDRFKSQFYIATIALAVGGRKKDACRFDSMIYVYCTDKQKNAIKHTYPLEWLEIPDSEFSAEECIKIAHRYEASKDLKNGFKWMMKAALKGNTAAQNDIGVYYALGKGRPVDGSEAVRWYKKAANGGSAVAWGNLAVRYYYGCTPFAKSLDKAKECYIKAYLIDSSGGYDKKLDNYFPNWRHEAHPLLSFSEKDEYNRIRVFAEAGITDAEYWYGVWLYKGENGCIQDKGAARRWFLKAAVYNHPLAISDLKAYYDIDAQEASIAKCMFDLGYSYSKKGGRQNQDLTFFWYYKAVINGYKSAYNNLGVCYDDGVGVEANYKKAVEYYLKAIRYENNTGALFNYGTCLYWGSGVSKNRKKAKEYLLMAKNRGNQSAVRFLEEHFGLTGTFEFEDFIAQTIYDNGGLKIEFCGIKDGNGKIQFKFLVDNTSTTQYNIWLRNVLLNGNEIEAFKKIGNYKANTGHQYETIELKGELSENNSSIEFEIEVDDSADHELFTTKRVKLDTLVAEKTLRFSLIDGTESKAQSNWNLKDYDFANEDFEDIVIYDNGGFRIEFGGLVVEDEEEVYIKIWSRNTSKEKYKIWLKDVVVDGERVSKYEEGAVCIPDGSWNYSRILAESVNVYDCYDIEFTAEINDENNNAVAMSKRVTVYVDFPNEEINVSLSEHADFEEN